MKFVYFIIISCLLFSSTSVAEENSKAESASRIQNLLPGFPINVEIEPAIPSNFVAMYPGENPNMFDGYYWGPKHVLEAFFKEPKSLSEAIIRVKGSTTPPDADPEISKIELREQLRKLGGKNIKEIDTAWGNYSVFSFQVESIRGLFAVHGWIFMMRMD